MSSAEAHPSPSRWPWAGVAVFATVALVQHDGSITFTVTDDGRGFDPASTGYGTGLQGIADRLGALDGSLEVTSRDGAGTSVTGTVPTSSLNPEAESEVLTS